MSNDVLIEGDTVVFNPGFGAAMVMVKPGKLRGSGNFSIDGKKVCIDGDEKKVQVPGCSYITPMHSIPGTGTLKIDSLAEDQKAKITRSNGKPVLLKGGMFNARFEVQSPAQQPPKPPVQPNPIPDSTKQYSGKGSFITTNTRFRGT